MLKIQVAFLLSFILSLGLGLANEKTAFFGLLLGGLNILFLTVLIALS